MIIVGQRHRHHEDCCCGCQWVEGLTGWLRQDSDTARLASMEDPMLVAEFDVPCPAAGKPRRPQRVSVAYTYAELGLSVPKPPAVTGEVQRLFSAPQTIRGQMTL